MKAAILKKLPLKFMLVLAFIFATVSKSFAAFPALLDKRENGEVSLTFYIVLGIIILVAIIIAVVTSREHETEEKNI